MDPVQIIISALVGAVANPIVKDAYVALKNLLKRKFPNDPTLQVALDNFEKKPNVWQKPLEEALIAVQVDKDVEVVSLAKELYNTVQTQGKIVHTGTGDILTDQSRKIITEGDYIEGTQTKISRDDV